MEITLIGKAFAAYFTGQARLPVEDIEKEIMVLRQRENPAALQASRLISFRKKGQYPQKNKDLISKNDGTMGIQRYIMGIQSSWSTNDGLIF